MNGYDIINYIIDRELIERVEALPNGNIIIWKEDAGEKLTEYIRGYKDVGK